MQDNNKLPIIILILIFQGCSIATNDLYSNKSVENIQKKCEDSIRSWINEYAAFPESYIPLLFEKLRIGSEYHKSTEIIPLRLYTVEHTFEIRDKKYNVKHVTLEFELTADYFIQDVRYCKQVLSLWCEEFFHQIISYGPNFMVGPLQKLIP